MPEPSARLPARERLVHGEQLATLIDRALLQSSLPMKAQAAELPNPGTKAMLPKAQRRPFPDLPARLEVELRSGECARRDCENLRRRARGQLARDHIREP